MESNFCKLCGRELKEGIYRINDSICPQLPKNTDKKMGCFEALLEMNQAVGRAYGEIAEKIEREIKDFLKSLNNDEKIKLEEALGLKLEEASKLSAKEIVKRIRDFLGIKKPSEIKQENASKYFAMKKEVMEMEREMKAISSCGRKRSPRKKK
jgi:hypothetical protein